jgi:hypothetical protein
MPFMTVLIRSRYGLDDRGLGVRVTVESRILTSPYRPDRLCGPYILLSNGCRGVKLTTQENVIYTSTSPYAFMTQCLVS